MKTLGHPLRRPHRETCSRKFLARPLSGGGCRFQSPRLRASASRSSQASSSAKASLIFERQTGRRPKIPQKRNGGVCCLATRGTPREVTRCPPPCNGITGSSALEHQDARRKREGTAQSCRSTHNCGTRAQSTVLMLTARLIPREAVGLH